MPLTGSDKAYKQARSGIARSGATRSGYISIVNGVVLLNSVDRSSSIVVSSLHVSLVLNDQPDTCAFTMKPGATIPSVGEPLTIGLGSSGNPIFKGQVVRVTHRRRHKVLTPFVDVDGIDWSLLFDRTIINHTYTSLSASEIAANLVGNFTSGFTTVNIQSGLPTIDYFPLTNAKPSEALRRLVNLMGGGGYYIDPDRDVHFFGTAGETGPLAPTNPQTLTNSLSSLKSFAHHYDFSQVRNRIWVEGQRTQIPISVPAFAQNFPILDATMFDPAGGQARIGTTLIDYTTINTPVSPGDNQQGTNVTTNTAAGATSLPVDSTAFVFSTGTIWVKVAEQYLRFAGSGGGALTGIPASGFGSIVVPIIAGEQVTACDMLFGVANIVTDQPKGTDVVLRVLVDNLTSHAAIQAIEGGSGVHEHVISDGRLNYDGCVARGQAELDAFSDPLVIITWDTEDMNAHPGAQQVVSLTTTDAFSTTLTITTVDLSWDTPSRPPRRRCEASTVRLAQLPEMIETETI